VTGYLYVVGACFCCRQIFTFSPTKVPSYRNEPICESCIERVNRKRRDEGRPLWPVAPGAYEPDAE